MKRVDQWEVVAAVAMRMREVNATTFHAFKVANNLDKLARIARSLHRHYEAMCNGDISPTEERRMNALETRVADIGRELGVYVECQRDPRGAPIKLWTGKQNESENAPGVRLLGVMTGGRS